MSNCCKLPRFPDQKGEVALLSLGEIRENQLGPTTLSPQSRKEKQRGNGSHTARWQGCKAKRHFVVLHRGEKGSPKKERDLP